MKRDIKEIVKMIIGMPRIKRKIKELNKYGYPVDSFLSLIQNDNETDTIVYTTKKFQPMANTFSNKYSFIGPSIASSSKLQEVSKERKVIYISLGTVLHQNHAFYQNCIKAFANSGDEVVMSVGEKTKIESLGAIPNHFTVKNKVDQLAVLQKADVFITHCGMNSVHESLYFGVPMVLFPQHSEQRMIANRVKELGAGVELKGIHPKYLQKQWIRCSIIRHFLRMQKSSPKTFVILVE